MNRSSVATFLVGVSMMLAGGLGLWLFDPQLGDSLLTNLVAFVVVATSVIGFFVLLVGILLLLDDVKDS